MKHHRIQAFKGPLLPCLGYGKNLVCYAAAGSVGDREAIDVLYLALDVTGTHALDVHGENFFFNMSWLMQVWFFLTS